MVGSRLPSPHPGCLVPDQAEAPQAKFKPAASTGVLQLDGVRGADLTRAVEMLLGR